MAHLLGRLTGSQRPSNSSSRAGEDAYKSQLAQITTAWTEQNEELQTTKNTLEKKEEIISRLRQRLLEKGDEQFEVDTLIDTISSSSSSSSLAASKYRRTMNTNSTSNSSNSSNGSGSRRPSERGVVVGEGYRGKAEEETTTRSSSSRSSDSTSQNTATNNNNNSGMNSVTNSPLRPSSSAGTAIASSSSSTTTSTLQSTSSTTSTSSSTTSSTTSSTSTFLAHSTPAAFARESPFSYAALSHLDARANGLEESLRSIVVAARDYEAAGVAMVTAADRLGTALVAAAGAPWAVVPGAETVSTSLSLVGHTIRDCGAMAQAANTTIHHAFGTSMEVDLLPALARTRHNKVVAETLGDESEQTLIKLMSTKRGAGAGEVLSKTSEVVQALHRAELSRFDAVAAFNRLEARRRIILVEKACAAGSALAGFYSQASIVANKLVDAHLRESGEEAMKARKRAAGRDVLWRLVRDGLETDFVRSVGLPGPGGGNNNNSSSSGSGSNHNNGDGFTMNGSSSSSSSSGSNGNSNNNMSQGDMTVNLGIQLVRQATAPIDKVADAVLKASMAITTKADPVDGGPLLLVAGIAGENSSSNSNTSQNGSTSSNITSSSTPSTAGRVAATFSSALDVPIAGWLFRRGTGSSGGVSSSGGSSSNGSGSSGGSGGWSRRWYFARSGRLYTMSTDSLAPTLVADLATCNVREGTDEEEFGGGGGSGGAIGVVGIAASTSSSTSSSSSSSSANTGNIEHHHTHSHHLSQQQQHNTSTTTSTTNTDHHHHHHHQSSSSSSASLGKFMKQAVKSGVGAVMGVSTSTASNTATGTMSNINNTRNGGSTTSSTATSCNGNSGGGGAAGGGLLVDIPSSPPTTTSNTSVASSSSSSSSSSPPPDVLPISYAAIHAFEIRTPSRIIVLAAPTLPQRKEWVRILRDLCEAALTPTAPSSSSSLNNNTSNYGSRHSSTGGGGFKPTFDENGDPSPGSFSSGATTTTTTDPSSLSETDIIALKERLRTCTYSGADIDLGLALIRSINSTCSECSAANPDWASLTLGVVFCLACSGVHRALGVHVSKVRSLVLDSWEPAYLLVLLGLGNTAANAVYAGKLLKEKTSSSMIGMMMTTTTTTTTTTMHLHPGSDRTERERFIRAKYEGKEFLLLLEEGGGGGNVNAVSDLDERCARSAAKGDLPDILFCVAHGSGTRNEAATGSGGREGISSSSSSSTAPAAVAFALHEAAIHEQLGAVALLVSHPGWDGSLINEENATPLEAYIAHAVDKCAAAEAGGGGEGGEGEEEDAGGGGVSGNGEKLTMALAHLLLPKRARAHAVAVAEAALRAAKTGNIAAARNALEMEKRARVSMW